MIVWSHCKELAFGTAHTAMFCVNELCINHPHATHWVHLLLMLYGCVSMRVSAVVVRVVDKGIVVRSDRN